MAFGRGDGTDFMIGEAPRQRFAPQAIGATLIGVTLIALIDRVVQLSCDRVGILSLKTVSVRGLGASARTQRIERYSAALVITV